MKRLLSEESRGIHNIGEIFGKPPVTWLRTFGDPSVKYTTLNLSKDNVRVRVRGYYLDRDQSKITPHFL